MPRFVSWTIVVTAILLANSVCAGVRGQNAWYEGFEGPNVSWCYAGGNVRHQTERHKRVQEQAHTGDGCEHLRLSGENGTFVHFSHKVGRALVIDELLPTVWVKSDRPGIQFLAQILLPRTVTPQTGRPALVLVRGSTYTDVGRWQQLRIEDVPRLLARQVRVLRTQSGPNVDGREAFLGAVFLNVYGGPGTTNVWIDDLDIAGFVGASSVQSSTTPPGTVGKGSAGDAGSKRISRGSAGRRTAAGVQPPAARLVGSVLIAEDRPFFPRIIQYRGEPLAFLQQVGFNTVWLPEPPSPEILAETKRLHLRLVCPPPHAVRLDLPDEPVAALAPVGPEYDHVLAWDLGSGLGSEQLERTRLWAEQVRTADQHRGRPLICGAGADLRTYSRHVDLLLIDRRPLGTSLELADWGKWIRLQPRLARPGTPVWTTIQTQPAAALREQLIASRPDTPPPVSVSSEQIRLLAYTAIGSGSRGLLFTSQSPLNAEDPETRHRAMVLELLNLEMELIEPWAAAGSFVTTADGSKREVTGAVLRTDRARLLLPVWSTAGAQCVPGQSAANNLSLVVPGTPEACNVYELTPGELRPLRHKRVMGGVRVTLEEFGLTAQVLFAQDPLVVGSLARRSAAIGPRAAELQRHLAVRKLHLVRQVVDRIPGRSADAQVVQWLSAAVKSIQAADRSLSVKDYPTTYVHARRAMRPLRLLQRAQWKAMLAGLPSPVTIPANVSFATLPWHARWSDRINASRLGPNRLVGGDFENLQATLRAGWYHGRHEIPGIQTAADLVPDAAHAGFSGLRLTVRPDNPEESPAMIETPPVWISSPAIAVEAGQMVCISGWVNIPKPVTGSIDGLMIIDSLAGEALAERISRTNGWQKFTLYRMAPQSGQVHVSFVLSGLGEVRLDDVGIRVLELVEMTRHPDPAPPPR